MTTIAQWIYDELKIKIEQSRKGNIALLEQLHRNEYNADQLRTLVIRLCERNLELAVMAEAFMRNRPVKKRKSTVLQEQDNTVRPLSDILPKAKTQ